MIDEKGIKLDLYDISILEVLKLQSETYKDDKYEMAIWKAKITKKVADHLKNNYKNTGKRGKGSDIHRSTVGRHVKKLMDEGLVDHVLFPEGTNSYADKGYFITEKGKGYLEAVNGKGGLAREYGSLCMGNYIMERHLDGCDNCDIDFEECYENIYTYLKDGIGISDEIVDEIIENEFGLKDMKEAVDLILTWEYLREAIEHGESGAGEGHKKNEALKLLATRDPRIMEIVCNTYSLPIEDINDIYMSWGEPGIPMVPLDQYIAIKAIYGEGKSDGLTVEEVSEKLKERGITYDPTSTLEACVGGNWFMEKVEVYGEVMYRLTEAGRCLIGGK